MPAIRAITDAGRRYHRDWVTRAYGPGLASLPPAIRRRKLAQLTAVTDLATWRLLPRELGLSPDPDHRSDPRARRRLPAMTPNEPR